MDQIRSKLFPEPKYDPTERDLAYRAFVLLASYLAKQGVLVLLDGTGHKLVWRELARRECPQFIEVYLRCPIEICMQRESARSDSAVRKQLYSDALERWRTGVKKEGLGSVPGVDEPFEQNPHPEILIDAAASPAQEQARQVLQALWPLLFP